jgi:hypothetical protein
MLEIDKVLNANANNPSAYKALALQNYGAFKPFVWNMKSAARNRMLGAYSNWKDSFKGDKEKNKKKAWQESKNSASFLFYQIFGDLIYNAYIGGMMALLGSLLAQQINKAYKQKYTYKNPFTDEFWKAKLTRTLFEWGIMSDVAAPSMFWLLLKGLSKREGIKNTEAFQREFENYGPFKFDIFGVFGSDIFEMSESGTKLLEQLKSGNLKDDWSVDALMLLQQALLATSERTAPMNPEIYQVLKELNTVLTYPEQHIKMKNNYIKSTTKN